MVVREQATLGKGGTQEGFTEEAAFKMELKDGRILQAEREQMKGEGDWKFQGIQLPEPQRTDTTL